MPGPEDWAEGVRTTSFQLAVEYDLNAKPGKLSPLVGTQAPYSDKMVEVVDRFDDEGGLDNKTARNEDTTYTDPSSTRRWIKKPQTADTAVLIDRDDMKATRVDIKSPMAVRTGNKVRRYHDNQWLNGFFGNAYSDETGSTTVTFDSNNIIAHGGVGLTKAKLITLRQMMLLNDVDIEEEEPILLIDPLSESDLLGITEYANADYNESKPLVRGEIKPWLGFRFVRCNLTSTRAYPDAASLVVPGSGQISLPAFVPSGLHRGVWTEFFGSIDALPGKKHSTQVYAEACSAVTRLNEKKCYQMRVFH
jgi:hypothetical protein